MNKTKSFLAVVGISLALTLTLSCSSDDGGDNTGGGGSSSSGGTGGRDDSSSSDGTGGGGGGGVTPANCTGYNPSAQSNRGTFTDSRGNKVYKSIKICDQIWMAENLSFNAPGSECYGGDEDNCNDYGRLYDWATTMDIDASYNDYNDPTSFYGTNYHCLEDNFCVYDPAVTPHQGICPSGWHLPSASEIYALLLGLYDFEGDNDRSVIGTKLKATEGWFDDGVPKNGTDDYGFAAQPGGYLDAGMEWRNLGEVGYSRGISELSNPNASHIRTVSLVLNQNGVGVGTGKEGVRAAKTSVRCVKNSN